MTHDPLIGTLVADKYRVDSLIARGGMGAVYRAVQEPLGRPVALKVLASRRASEAEWEVDEARFFREASVASKLTHPNTVVIHDYGAMEGHGGYFLVMEFLEGKTLAQVVEELGPLKPARLLHIAKQIASSLSEAHKSGVVHRDLKPANVILIDRAEDPDFAKIVDFGLVRAIDEAPENRVTEEGTVMGSPLYISPEQIMDMDVDHRADVYALGCVLYEMATGRPPYIQKPGERGIGGIMRGHLLLEPPPMAQARPGLEVSAEIEAITRRCLNKQPDARYQTMSELYAALDGVWLPPSRAGQVQEAPEETVEMTLDDLRAEAALSAERAGKAPPQPSGTAKLQRLDGGEAPPPGPAVGPETGRQARLRPHGAGVAPPSPAPRDAAPNRRRLMWLALVVVLLVAGAIAAWIAVTGGDDVAARSEPRGDAGAVAPAGAAPARERPRALAAARVANHEGPAAAQPRPSHGPSAMGPAGRGPVAPPETEKTKPEAAPGAGGEAVDAQHVRVTIESRPPGAKVFDIEDLVGRTPVTLDVDRDSLPRSYRLVKRGYARATAEVPEVDAAARGAAPGDGGLTVTVTLKRRAAPARPPTAPASAPGDGIKLTR